MKAAAIPSVQSLSPEMRRVVGPLVEVVETVTGRRVQKIEPLPANAGTGEIIDKVNEIIERLQV
jgi:hypothetical protein